MLSILKPTPINFTVTVRGASHLARVLEALAKQPTRNRHERRAAWKRAKKHVSTLVADAPLASIGSDAVLTIHSGTRPATPTALPNTELYRFAKFGASSTATSKAQTIES